MLTRKALVSSLLAVLAAMSVSCVSPSKPVLSNKPYSQLDVGNVEQFVFSNDSSTLLVEIVGTTHRRDGREVFIEKDMAGISAPDTSYEFVKDGFLIITRLDTVDTTKDTGFIYIPSNPFFEQRLAETYPKEGDKWIHTSGDDTSFFWIASKPDSFAAICSTFRDVFAFDLYQANQVLITVYYARGMHWVGSSVTGSMPLTVSCCYAKVGGVEIGTMRPAKAATSQVLNKQLVKQVRRSFFVNSCGRFTLSK